MLLNRSVLLEVCLLLAVSQICCQSYDYGAEGEDHSDVSEYEHPDYSKYFSVDSSAPLVSTVDDNKENYGFVSPLEFSGSFFGPETASSVKTLAKQSGTFIPQEKQLVGLDTVKQGFPEYYQNSPFPKDYFEESQKQQNLEKQQEDGEESPSEVRPGPNYISYKVPTIHITKDIDYKPENSHEVESIRNPHKGKGRKPIKKDYNDDIEDHQETANKYRSADYEPVPANHNKYIDYNTGKSSSTVSQYPQAQGLYTPSESAPSTLTPYQKFSFQPTTDELKPKFLDTVISTAAPFNPSYTKIANAGTSPVAYESQPTENVPSHLLGKNCRKITKPSSEAGVDSINCFVCEDLSTKSKHTQCSYSLEPQPTNYYSGTSERYSTPGKGPDGFRYKRYTGGQKDPYEYIKARSQKLYDQPSASETIDDFTPFYDSGPTEEEKSYSELQSEELAKNPGNCHKVDREGMTCTVCKNEATGGNFEQCSYTSEPKEQKYAYITEKKYDSAEEPDETKSVAQTKLPEKHVDGKYNKKTSHDIEPIEGYESRIRNNKRPERNEELKGSSSRRHEESRNDRDPYERKLVDDDPYEVPKHFAESTEKQKKTGGKGVDSSLYGGESAEASESKEKTDEYKDIDEYHFKLFPEFVNEESRKEEAQAEYASESRQDVEDVLAEFSKKDRSQCKKAEKNGMTCYLCVDQNKIQHEECMYVSESRPKATHVAYHEVQHLKSPENGKAETQQVTEQVPLESKEKTFYKKVTTPSTVNLEAAASQKRETRVPFRSSKKSVKTSRKTNKKDPKTASSERVDSEGDPDIETPKEFIVGDEEGAFSAETKPVYSKALGVKLPRYMVERSEFEKEFDEASGGH